MKTSVAWVTFGTWTSLAVATSKKFRYNASFFEISEFWGFDFAAGVDRLKIEKGIVGPSDCLEVQVEVDIEIKVDVWKVYDIGNGRQI